jgi:hypothetical protein
MGAANAWVVEPRTGVRTLQPDETMTIDVAFAPKDPGHYDAYIVLDAAGREERVDLFGDALGERREQTSFYACTCDGSDPASHQLAIVLAIAFLILVPRRPGF